MALLKLLLAGFKNPVLRPRLIIWAVVAMVAFSGFMVPVLAVTSTRWFCENGCHKVQDDTITAYQHSVHSQVSCLACHLPPHVTPLVFLLHKMSAVGELYDAVTNRYTLPLNAEDEVAFTMPVEQCTQCHDVVKYKVTPHAGFKINHQVHIGKGIACPICHNRAAHKEDFQFTLIDPNTGKTNHPHADFMKMTACFRCHSQSPVKGGPSGQCSLCHTADFHLKPTSHEADGFFPKGHGRLALAEEKRVPWLSAVDTTQTRLAATLSAKTFLDGSPEKPVDGTELPTVEDINSCSTCHAKTFCSGCHGIAMPHQADFKKNHGDLGKANPGVCVKCHGPSDGFCGNCHHGTHLKFPINPKLTWKQQHPIAVKKVGPAGCVQLAGCHSPTFCATCHANGGNIPPGGPQL
jgi:hypothetical protein